MGFFIIFVDTCNRLCH